MGLFDFWRRQRPEFADISELTIVTWERDHVRVAVIQLGDGVAELMGVAAAPVNGIGGTHHPDIDRWFAGCNHALDQAESMTKASHGHTLVPDYAMMSLPAEITHHMNVSVSRKRRPGNQPVTFDEVEALVQRGYRRAQDILGPSSRDAVDDIICGTLVETRLDGQRVPDPVGLNGDALTLSLTFFLAPIEWIRALEIIAERLELGLTAIVPQHVALASAISETCAFMVVADEHHTLVSKVRHGRIEWASQHEIGEREVIAATGARFNLNAAQSDELMRLYRAGQLRAEIHDEVSRSYWRELCQWMGVLADGVRLQPVDGRVPYHAYYMDVTRRFADGKSSLETPYWENKVGCDRCPEVATYSVHTIHDVLDCTAQAQGPGFLPLRALAHYAAVVYSVDRRERALAETVRHVRPVATKA